jgi:DNA-directed RNA polymerase specialized sigma24 family protein
METLFTQLEREWPALARQPATATALADACALAGVASPTRLVSMMRGAAPSAADPVMAHLAGRARDGCEMAARTLLQLLLPGTCRLAARWWALGSAEERAATAVAAVYARIRRYPVDRRPTKVAANILLDANQDLARIARRLVAERQRTAPVEPRLLLGSLDPPEPSPADELRELVEEAVAAGRVPAHWAALIVATHIEGHDLPTIARRTGTPVRTLQWRRRSAEAALIAEAAA